MPALMEILDFLAQLDLLGSQVLKDLRGMLDRMVSPVFKVLLDCLEDRVPVDYRDLLDHLDHKASLVREAHLVNLASQVSTVLLEIIIINE